METVFFKDLTIKRKLNVINVWNKWITEESNNAMPYTVENIDTLFHEVIFLFDNDVMVASIAHCSRSIYQLYVDTEYRNEYYGSLILSKMKNYLKNELNYHYCLLCCENDLLHFYKKNGFLIEHYEEGNKYSYYMKQYLH